MDIDMLDKSTDSFAYWNVPKVDLDSTSAKTREDAFKLAYTPGFPSEYKDILPKASEVKYVFVGLNRGNNGNDGKLTNFHGLIKSGDYRLAAAAYNTAAWGAFMTDISNEVNSDSSKVTVTTEHVENLIKHLEDIGIPRTAVLIALGRKVYTTLETNKELTHRKIEYIPHYSMQNGHWNADKVHQLLQKITKTD